MTELKPQALTRELGVLLAEVDTHAIPPASHRIAVRGLADAVGTMIAARFEPAVQILQSVLPSPGEAHVCFSLESAHAPDAARINGTAAHALDFDDVSIQGHPSAVLLAALLPEAEVLGSSGTSFLDAYVLGFETWAELVLREPDQHHRKGWHPTGLFGAIGAAAACARLRRLNARQCAHALSIAASQSSGVMSNFGSMVKPFHAGSAAYAGVLSARLAASGMQASGDTLEHRQGLLRAVSPEGRVDLTSPIQAAKNWHLLARGLTFKKYPTCLSTHRGLDGIFQLLGETPIDADAVQRVTVKMSERNATILHAHRPQTALEGKFSIEFAMAAALIAKRLTLAELTDDFVRRSDVQALISKVEIENDSREDPLTGYAPEDVVTVATKSGLKLTAEIGDMRGTPANPLKDQDLFVKFDSCLKAGGFQQNPAEMFEDILALEKTGNMSTFIKRWRDVKPRRDGTAIRIASHA